MCILKFEFKRNSPLEALFLHWSVWQRTGDTVRKFWNLNSMREKIYPYFNSISNVVLINKPVLKAYFKTALLLKIIWNLKRKRKYKCIQNRNLNDNNFNKKASLIKMSWFGDILWYAVSEKLQWICPHASNCKRNIFMFNYTFAKAFSSLRFSIQTRII